MSQDTLRKLVVALAVVGVLWMVVAVFTGPGAPPDASAHLLGFFGQVESEASIRTVRLEGPEGEPVELIATGDTWTVNGFPTDSGTVTRFLSALSDAEVGDLVARNIRNHARMGVAEFAGHTLQVEANGYSGTVVVGDQGPRFGTTYVRAPGEDEVYLLEGDLRGHVRRSLDDWRSKRVVAVDSTGVFRLEVSRDGDSYAVSRRDSTWAFEDGSEADASTLRSLLGELRDLQASGFLQEGDSLAALEAGGWVRALSGTGATLAEIELGAGEADRWVRVQGDSVVYRLASYRVDRVAPVLERVRTGG